MENNLKAVVVLAIVILLNLAGAPDLLAEEPDRMTKRALLLEFARVGR